MISISVATRILIRTYKFSKAIMHFRLTGTPDTPLRKPFWETLLQQETVIYGLLNNALDEITQRVENASFSSTDQSGTWMVGEPVFDSGRSREFFLFNNVYTGFEACSLGTFFQKRTVAGVCS